MSSRFLLLGILLFALFSWSSTVEAQNLTISSVEVRGNLTADRSLILSVADITIGAVLTSTSTQDAIRAIYGLGLFSDVRIKGEVTDEQTIDLIIEVEEYPRVTRVDYSGNDKLDDDDIKEVDSIEVGRQVPPHELKQATERIRRKYQDKGYYLVNIETELKPVEGSQLNHELLIKLDEGPKIRIMDIVFEGNDVFTDDKLRGKMGNKPKGFLRSGNFDPEKHEEDKEKIIEFYHEKGYLDADILHDTVIVHEDDPRWMTVKIEVYEGIQYRYGDTKFTGNKIYGDKLLHSRLKYDEGDIFNSEKFEESISELYAVYQEDGYIHARIFENISTVDSILNIEFEVSEGVPAKIHKIVINGNTKTKEKVIRREMASRPGQVFRRSALMRSVRNVMLLNYFGKAEPDFKVLPNGDVDLILEVEEKPTGQFNAGAGYSGQDKLVGTVSLGMPNFRGNGQTLQLSTEFGSRRNSLSLSFTEPWLFGTPTSFSASIYNLNRKWYDDFWEGRRGGSVRFGRRLRWPDDYFRVYASYRLEDIRYYDFEDSVYAADPNSLARFNEDWLRTSSVTSTLMRDSRDLPMFPTSGSVHSYTVEYAGGPLGGEWQYHKHTFEVKHFYKLFWKFVLAGKLKLGVVDSPDGDDGVPFTERFSPGGTDPDGTLRGYEDGDVTPKDDDGYNIRGRSMLVYNAEIQFPVVEQQIYGLLFADAGNSWLAGYQITPFDFKGELKRSIGAGFRVVIPGIGILGFDFAYGYDKDDPGWKPHFQIGSTF